MLHHLIPLLSLIGPALFFGIGEGPSGQETQQYGDIANLANFATGAGESDIASADTFWQAILSGDPNQIAKVLGPQISAINKQGQQSLKTASEFGNRGGGTNAFAQTTGDTTRSNVDTLIAQLTGQAGGQLGSLGSSLLSTGSSAHGQAFNEADTIHSQNLAKWNDIFNSIAQVVSGVAGGVGGGFGGGEGSNFGDVGNATNIMSGFGDSPTADIGNV